MTTVAVTGASGLVGEHLLPVLAAQPGVDEVVAIDLRRPAAPAVFRNADIRDREALGWAFSGVDAVVHLAARFDAGLDIEAMHDVNVGGTRNVLEVAREVGVGKVIVASSASAYGAHDDNELPLTEEAPLRANPGFAYAEHKRELDLWAQSWATDAPVVTILRPAIVAGAGVDNFVVRNFLAPRLPAIRGHRPPFQFVHVDDLVAAIVHVVEHDLPGAYNVASEGWLSMEEVAAILSRKLIDIPEELAFAASARTHTLGLSEIPPGAVHYFMHPWVVSVDKLVATGWRPRHSNRDALALIAAEHGDRVSIGKYMTTRRQLRSAAGIGAGVAGGVLALGVLAARRRRRE